MIQPFQTRRELRLSDLHRERAWISLKGVPNLYHSAYLKQTESHYRASKHLQVSALRQSSPSLAECDSSYAKVTGFWVIQAFSVDVESICSHSVMKLGHITPQFHCTFSSTDRHKDSSFKSLQNRKVFPSSGTKIPISPWHHYLVAITPRCWDHI